jgi:hypothetical protein
MTSRDQLLPAMLAEAFTSWPPTPPIARLRFEWGLLSGGHTHEWCSAFDANGRCLQPEGPGIDGDELFGNHERAGFDAAAQLERLAEAFRRALPKALNTPGFRALPKHAVVTFEVGFHGGPGPLEVYQWRGMPSAEPSNERTSQAPRLEKAFGLHTRSKNQLLAQALSQLASLNAHDASRSMVLHVRACLDELRRRAPRAIDSLDVVWVTGSTVARVYVHDGRVPLKTRLDVGVVVGLKRPRLFGDELAKLRYAMSLRLATVLALSFDSLEGTLTEVARGGPMQCRVSNQAAGAPALFFALTRVG